MKYSDIEYIYPYLPKHARTMPYLRVDGINRETDKAICFAIGGDDLWIPKSVIEGNVKKNGLNLPRWFKFGGNNYNTFSKHVETLPC